MYVSNRGHNSVAVFKVKEDKTLEAPGHITSDIKIAAELQHRPERQVDADLPVKTAARSACGNVT